MVKMEKRLKELSEIHCFIEGIDKEVSVILQGLKWDKRRLLEDVPKATCSYDKSHKLPPDRKECHEMQCFLKSHGYDKDDLLLPDPLDINANTLIKFDKQAVITIINNASYSDPLFKGNRSRSPEPWTLERLQASYTADERRALHHAVVQAVPSCHDLADLALPRAGNVDPAKRSKSRAEILAELRDMKRRRNKYRVAAKTLKYSDVLREVIKTQMEFYSEAAQKITREENYHKDHEKGVGKQSVCDYSSTSRYEGRNRSREKISPSEKGSDRRHRKDDTSTSKHDRVESQRVGSSSRDHSQRYAQKEYSSTSRYERYSSNYKNKHNYPPKERRDNGTSNRDKDVTPHRESTDRDTHNNYSHTSRHTGNTHSTSENKNTPSRRRIREESKTRDSDYQPRYKRDRYIEARKPTETHGNDYNNKSLRSKGRTSEERDPSMKRNRIKETRQDNSSKFRYQNITIEETGIPIKTEKEDSSERECSEKEIYDNVYAFKNTKHRRGDGNSSWERDETILRIRRTTPEKYRDEEPSTTVKLERDSTPQPRELRKSRIQKSHNFFTSSSTTNMDCKYPFVPIKEDIPETSTKSRDRFSSYEDTRRHHRPHNDEDKNSKDKNKSKSRTYECHDGLYPTRYHARYTDDSYEEGGRKRKAHS